MLWSVRMRASKGGLHISGAEGLYADSDVEDAISTYHARAVGHPRGMPDEVVITVEKVAERPKRIGLLQVATVECKSTGDAESAAFRMLLASGITRRAAKRGLAIIRSKRPLSGAVIISSTTGKRLDGAGTKGVRASRLGMLPKVQRALSRALSRKGINTDTVKEALLLASKVAASGAVNAELCASDDPHYTTGYISSSEHGYVRITNIKGKGDASGGRVFFVDDAAGINALVQYLTRTPVLAVRPPEKIAGSVSVDALIG